MSRIVLLDPVFSLSSLDLSFSFAAFVTVNMVSPSRARPCPLGNGCPATMDAKPRSPFRLRKQGTKMPRQVCVDSSCSQKKIAGIEAHAGDPMFEAIRCEIPGAGRNAFATFYVTYRIPSFRRTSQFLFHAPLEQAAKSLSHRHFILQNTQRLCVLRCLPDGNRGTLQVLSGKKASSGCSIN